VDRRRAVFDAMREAAIGVQVHYVPIHHHRVAVDHGAFPAADRAYERLLSLPLYPDLTDAEQDRVIDALLVAIDPGR
jgi:perosamine synthetase